MPKLSLLDLCDWFDEHTIERIVAKGKNKNEGVREQVLSELNAIDAKSVAWFAERGIELIVDRDPMTYKRIKG